jgi:prolyl oligopeptidase
MMQKRFLLFALVSFLFIHFSSAQTLTYPQPKKVDDVDNYHGTMVADPYRWMEDENSPDLKSWIEEENKITFNYLDAIPERRQIKERITNLWNYARMSVPFRHGKRYFFSKNDGLQNQSVIYMQNELQAEPKRVIDPNTLSTDGTVSISLTSYSKDGALMAYGVSRSGSDWQEIMIRDLETGKDFPDTLRRCKFASIAWDTDNRGFYYDKFPNEGTVPKDEESYHQKAYWHTLGTQQSEDKLVYERPDAKELSISPTITDDGKYLVFYLYRGTDNENRIHYMNLETKGTIVRLFDKADAEYILIGNEGSTFYFRTDNNAPKGRVVAVELSKPEPKDWKELIPESNDVLTNATIINNQFVTLYLRDVHHVLKIFSLDGKFIRTIDLPTLGSVGGLSGEREDTEMFFSFTSFVYPTTIYRYDFTTNSLSTFFSPKVPFDASAYETKQVFYHSKDGTRIPMFLTHKKEMKFDGNNPTLLYGYGGFNVNLTPNFQPWRIVWLENGGIYASANIRGGSEYGEGWHKAGVQDKKQNVFDDFIYAARWLTENKYTTTSKLAIMGGSNGGLLVAACMLQQPELFGAVICQVPVTDMLRYHKFTIGRYWVSDYGNAEENPDHFKFMYAYSPLHNIKNKVEYPPIIITTADHDDRVVPAHAMKFAATLQEADAGKTPVLLRIETKAGHGG